MNPEFESRSNGPGWKQLTELVGLDNITFDAARIRGIWGDGQLPCAAVYPSNAEQVCKIVRLAHRERWKVAPVGNGTKQRMGGRAREIDLAISLSRLNQLIEYEPADLTITAQAGMPLSELTRILQAKGQMLPLDAGFNEGATVGGALATNSSGPRRLGYGTLRDFVVGVHFVTADGALIKSGGKVVKNVAGYDMIKVLIGSFGTLGIVTDVSFRAFPVPPASVTFLFAFATANQALQASRRILKSPLQPQAMDLLTSRASELAGEIHTKDSSYLLAVGAAGSNAVVDRFRHDLPILVHHDGPAAIANLDGDEETAFWRQIQEMTPSILDQHAASAVVRASVVLTGIGEVLERAENAARTHGLKSAALARAGNGIVYCYLWPEAPSGESSPSQLAAPCTALMKDIAALGGRSVVEFSPPSLDGILDPWAPLPEDFSMMQRLKAGLDPEDLMNPGRLYGKI